VSFWVLSVLFVTIKSNAATFDVRAYGAKGDQKTNDRAAIQRAVGACSTAGGGTVYFPPGNYLSGTIRLRSNITLQLDAGATLWASTNQNDYEKGYSHLILAENVENVSIIGSGTINGQATADFGRRRDVQEERPSFRTHIMLFQNCRRVTIRDVAILYSDSWTIHLKRCENVFIDGVTILNNYYRTNSDGIDPNSCRNVHISNCHIVAGDDCIVLKSTESYPCENVVVTNCTLETIATALKLGTESRGDFRNIHFSNCTIRNTPVGIGFYMKDGATMERVTCSNISIEATSPTLHSVYPIFMDIEKRHPDSRIGTIRDVVFRDIQIQSGSGSLIQGMPESPIENVTLQNITVRAERVEDQTKRSKPIGGTRTTRDERDTKYARQPAYLILAHVKGLLLDNVRVLPSDDAMLQSPRSAMSGHQLENGIIRGVYRSPGGDAAKDAPVVVLSDCREMLLTGCQPAHGTPLFLRLAGKDTSRISLVGNDLRNATRPIVQNEDVPANAVSDAESKR
jgi:polygalacturonase